MSSNSSLKYDDTNIDNICKNLTYLLTKDEINNLTSVCLLLSEYNCITNQ